MGVFFIKFSCLLLSRIVGGSRKWKKISFLLSSFYTFFLEEEQIRRFAGNLIFLLARFHCVARRKRQKRPRIVLLLGTPDFPTRERLLTVPSLQWRGRQEGKNLTTNANINIRWYNAATQSQGYWVLYHHHHLKMTLEKSQWFIYWERWRRRGGKRKIIDSRPALKPEKIIKMLIRERDFRFRMAKCWVMTFSSFSDREISLIRHYACRIHNGIINREHLRP